MQHLLNDLVGHGGDVGTGQRAIGHMDGVAELAAMIWVLMSG